MKKINSSVENELTLAMKNMKRNGGTKVYEKLMWAANYGDAHAQYLIGLGYDEGISCCEDHISATNYFRLSALQKHPSSMCLYAIALFMGTGTPQNLEESKSLLEEAIAMGCSDAQRILDLIYEYESEGIDAM